MILSEIIPYIEQAHKMLNQCEKMSMSEYIN